MREILFFFIGIVLTGAVFLGFQKNLAEAPEQQVATSQSANTEESVSEYVEPEQKKTYRVLKVVDGDTLAIEMDGKSVTVRLIGLDTPETLDPRKPIQCFGQEASKKAKSMLSGKKVSIETDSTQGEYDKYGRVLAYIYLEDGTLFNESMIAEGYGHEYTYNLPYKYQSEFKATEKQAREQKRGLWADNACALESTRSPVPQVTPAPTGSYECSKNTYNCSSFTSQAAAQSAFDACGGNNNDVHKLDNDKDGSVCESLP